MPLFADIDKCHEPPNYRTDDLAPKKGETIKIINIFTTWAGLNQLKVVN